MNIGIIGVGVVGSALALGFRKIGHKVFEHDTKFVNTSLANVLDNTSIVFICVPTATRYDGSADTGIVQAVVHDIAQHGYTGLVVIKSTVPPGTTDALQTAYYNQAIYLAFCPEFLREKSAYSDFVEHHDVCIIGTESPSAYALVKEAHGRLPKNFVQMTATEAELCKYFGNVFNAMRITFANQFHEVCKVMNADYGKIKNAMVLRNNISDHYLDSNESMGAFGGACLPKDTLAFAIFVQKLGLAERTSLFRHIVAYNERSSRSEQEKKTEAAE